MSAPVSPSEFAFPAVPRFVRARGAIRARFAKHGARTGLADLQEAGGYRLRFPRGAECEAVIVNTGGGVAGGDRLSMAFTLDAGARAVITTVAAEKIYRSDSRDAEIDVKLELGGGAALAWLPQETILFSGARLRRALHVDMPGEARLTLMESIVFGRQAMGESMESGALADQWRIRRDGRLVFAEALRLTGDIAGILARPATGAGARAIATLVHVAPDAEAALEDMRAGFEGEACECAASGFGGMLVARFISPSPEALRSAIVSVMARLRGVAAPRVWQS